jgi:hypothetical protein
MTKFGDRYGYYQIGDTKTYSRYELMDIHYASPQPWKWDYNDNFFSSYNWNIEPHETLGELYKKRAEQLRRDYDYLILYYSGGHDSVNMLNAFLDNNIPIDEICVRYSKIDTVSEQYKELQTITWDKFDRLKKKHKNIVFRKLDYTDYFFKWYEDLKSLNLNKELIHMFGISLSINRLVSDLLFKNVDSWKMLLKSGKKIAWVSGVDKPTIRFNNNEWIFNFHDALIQWNVTPMWQMIDDGKIGTHEFFYWAPQHESAKILIKQCHLIKNYYNKQEKNSSSKTINDNPYTRGYGYSIDKNGLPLLNILYPKNFSENFFVMDLLNLHVLGDRDQWYINTQLPGSQIHWQLYQSILNDCEKEHYRPWYKDKKTIDSGFHNAISKNYII